MDKADKDKAKNVRRGAKAALTRTINTAKELIGANRSMDEVKQAFVEIKKAYENLLVKHEEFTVSLDDEEFEEAEHWLQTCTSEYVAFSMICHDYTKEINEVLSNNTSNSIGNELSASNSNSNVTEESEEHIEESNVSNDQNELNTEQSPEIVQPNPSTVKPFTVKHEKAKLPMFTGDVRQYFIFKSDFKHAVEAHYSERDTLTVLRSCLSSEPAKLIEGISSDLNAAWKYLDQNYGDPRVVSDTVTLDLERFKSIQPGEENRFCQLVNLVRRSYNILKEIKRPQDMDNTHVMSLIERKMSEDDLRVWARHLNSEKCEPSMENLLSWMESEMTARMRSGAQIRRNIRSNRVNAFGSKTGNASDGKHGEDRFKWKQCYVCQGQHYVDECQRFRDMNPNERWKVVKDQRACFSCLKKGKGHTVANCSRRKPCGEKQQSDNICSKPHHKLLHVDASESKTPAHIGFTQDGSGTLLPVHVGQLKNKSRSKDINVFYDSGAQISMVRKDLAEEMGLEGTSIKIVITKVGGAEEELDTKMYKVPVTTYQGKKVQVVQAVGISHISDDVTNVNLSRISDIFGIPANQLERRSGPVDLLIGINHPQFHVGEARIKDGLAVRKTPIGWVAFGAENEYIQPKTSQVMNVRLATPVDLTEFWKTESMGVSISPCQCPPNKMTEEEQRGLKLIEESCNLNDKRWTMSYPWKKSPQLLPDNYPQVVKKMEATEHRLSKQPNHAKSYDEQIEEMEKMKFSRKLTKREIEEWKGPVHYVAHHAVVRPENKSTPVRIVFNSSASYKGHSLNDYWYKGPDLLNNLFGVILRFREKKVAVVGDISKMYHMIAIPLSDQHVHRFLWRNMQLDRKPDVYVKTVLTFGDRPSPTMATVAMRKTAEMQEESKPKAAEAIKKNTYMDDVCDSQPTLEAAKELISDVDEVLDAGGFRIKEWISNVALTDQKSRDEVVLGKPNENDVQKVLGTVWHPKDDQFSFAVKSVPSNEETCTSSKMMKRIILGKLSGIFDPVGAGVATLVKAKIGMQELWQRGLSWDEEIPPDLKRKWTMLFKEMAALEKVRFQPCLTPTGAINNPELITFCDASRMAFGACSYIRWQLADGKFGVRFVAAKSRVAPLKELTIPRLELQAAVLASRLAKSILEETRLKMRRTLFFSDSRVTLAWIQGTPRSFKPFVSCRVSEIQSNSNPTDWHHCPTAENVADDLTKGITPEQLKGRWFNGPTFLTLPEEEWPMETGMASKHEVDKERRKIIVTAPVTVTQPIFDCQRYSKWKRIVRITAYVQRFCRALLVKHDHDDKNIQRELEHLTTEELQAAEEYWIKHAQSSLVRRLKKGEFKTLSPFVDDRKIIRVGSRVDPSLVSYENERPVLLPYDHYLSKIIVRDAHEVGHNGVAATVAKTRKKYWIIKAHRIAKVLKSRCTVCREIEAKVETQLMANLPKFRLQPHTPPFLYSSVDYFGPMKVKVGRNKTSKHYGVVFTCLNTRAIHCELAVDDSAMELMQVLRRFFSYRGYPKVLLSDNGTQMVGAENELRLMIKGWNVNQLKEFCADRSIKWQFTTPLAPHQNAATEAMVKTVKVALKKAVGDAVLAPFELHTCLVEIANLVNQRPIGRIPTDPDDGSYLCPNDILLGRATSTVPQGPFRQTKNPYHRFEFCQRIVDAFWKKWSRDVLPQLVPRRKWNTASRNVKVDDYVVVADPNAMRGKWEVGKVVQVFPGDDGYVRNVLVKTNRGNYTRSISKIAVIYPAEGYEDE